MGVRYHISEDASCLIILLIKYGVEEFDEEKINHENIALKIVIIRGEDLRDKGKTGSKKNGDKTQLREEPAVIAVIARKDVGKTIFLSSFDI